MFVGFRSFAFFLRALCFGGVRGWRDTTTRGAGGERVLSMEGGQFWAIPFGASFLRLQATPPSVHRKAEGEALEMGRRKGGRRASGPSRWSHGMFRIFRMCLGPCAPKQRLLRSAEKRGNRR